MARKTWGRRELPPPTQEQIIVEEFIEENIALLKDGTLLQVIEVGACDVDMMTESQQGWLLSQFRTFLLGLNFPLQIVIASEQQNIAPWVEALMEAARSWQEKLSGLHPDGSEREVLERLKDRAGERVEWVQRLHSLTRPQAQRYYLVLYSNPLPLRTSRRQLTESLYQQAREELARNRVYVVESLQEMGLSTRTLREGDLKAILSHFYKRRIPPLDETPKQALLSLVYGPEGEGEMAWREQSTPSHPVPPGQERVPSPGEGEGRVPQRREPEAREGALRSAPPWLEPPPPPPESVPPSSSPLSAIPL